MKKIFFFLFSLFFATFLYSQDIEKAKPNSPEEEVVENTSENDSSKAKVLNTSAFGFYFGTQLITSKTNNPTDPKLGVSVDLGAEYEYSPIKYFSINPSIDFSVFHYGFLGNASKGQAYISEHENRTALTLAFLLDVPFMAKFEVKSWTLSIGGGLAFLIRGAFLEPGVDANQINGVGLTAKEELKLANTYFWKSARFIYPSLGFKIEHSFDSAWKVGFKFKTFLPIYKAWDKENKNFADSLIFQMAIVLHPSKN